MEQRDECGFAGKPFGNQGAQLGARALWQALGKLHRFSREAQRAAFRAALWRPPRGARQGEFQGVAMLRGAAQKSAGLRAAAKISQPRCPKISAHKPEEIRHGLWIMGNFGKRHGKYPVAHGTRLLAPRGNALQKPSQPHLAPAPPR
jgi:hypothetical protein